jgi:hypothetical protein
MEFEKTYVHHAKPKLVGLTGTNMGNIRLSRSRMVVSTHFIQFFNVSREGEVVQAKKKSQHCSSRRKSAFVAN